MKPSDEQIGEWCAHATATVPFPQVARTVVERAIAWPAFVGLTLEEIEDIIKSNITITDQRLYEGVYAVAVDIEIKLMEKNT